MNQKSRMKTTYRILLLAIVLIFPAGLAAVPPALPAANEKLPVPDAPSAWVNDYADIFSSNEEARLNQKLGMFEQHNSIQIFVVTLDDNGGYPADMLAPLVGERWGVGQKGQDNGIVILIDMGERDMFIATGYGNEESVTDLEAGLIVRNEIIPAFREGDYYGGVDAATGVLISLLDGEYTPQEYREQVGSGSGGGAGIGGIIFMIILFSLIFGGRRRSAGIGRSNLPLWLALGALSGSRHSGSWGSFSSGSGGFGGGGGFGGFSGGGGGSFGGGGAGGSW